MPSALSATKEWRRQYEREWVKRNPRRAANKALKHLYGITLDDYERILAEQGGCCRICGGSANGKGRLHVDHCHTTGAVRGLLCSPCNTGLGQFKDSPERLRAAIEYLESRR